MYVVGYSSTYKTWTPNHLGMTLERHIRVEQGDIERSVHHTTGHRLYIDIAAQICL